MRSGCRIDASKIAPIRGQVGLDQTLRSKDELDEWNLIHEPHTKAYGTVIQFRLGCLLDSARSILLRMQVLS
jgi:hypothetical protein